MKNIMTRTEWNKKQVIKKRICKAIVLLGGLALLASFLMDGPASKYNGPIFAVGLATTVIGIVSFLVLQDQKYKDYRKDALQ